MAFIHDTDPWATPEAPRRGYRWLWLLPILAVAGGVGFYFWHQRVTFDAVTADSGRVMLDAESEENLATIDPRTGPEVYYRAIVRGAPTGAVLPLTCEWLDPNGDVYHRNRYETKPINRPEWPTHARCRIRPDAPTGEWGVYLSLRGRLLHQMSFHVRPAGPEGELDPKP